MGSRCCGCCPVGARGGWRRRKVCVSSHCAALCTAENLKGLAMVRLVAEMAGYPRGALGMALRSAGADSHLNLALRS